MAADRMNALYDSAVDGWVRAAFNRGVRSFPDLVRTLPGVYPSDALRAVRRLAAELPAGWQGNGGRAARPSPPADGWPVEHPLDYDWRFAPAAARLLGDRIGEEREGGKPVALLAAPSLIIEAAARGWRDGVCLLDANPAVVTAARASFPGIDAECVDLVWGPPVGSRGAAVSVADPPWYPEHTLAFLWSAAQLTRVGGCVFLSLPPEGTRPGILAEREETFVRAESFGLYVASVERGALPYRMPTFERNALVAAGISGMPSTWRKGDLAVFVLGAKTRAPRPIPPGPRERWVEEAVGAVRIKCRRSADCEFRDPALSPVVEGDMLVSVSRRHPARAAVDVWTSGNRVFRCAGPGIFRLILSALRRGVDVDGTVAAGLGRELTARETTLVRRAVEQALDLVRREERELGAHGHRRHRHDVVAAP